MTQVLVVDDARVDRLIVAELLGRDEDITVTCVADGASALESIERDPPDMVLTDLRMPGMDGFEVVAAVRERFPGIPVILMTSQGSEEIAVRALKEGASSYVPKQRMAAILRDTVQEVLELAGRQLAEERLLASLEKSESTFRIENRQELIRPLVNYLQETTALMGLCDEAERMQVGVALSEALNNALEHGNLEVPSAVREDDLDAYFELVRRRAAEPPYRDRRIHVEVSFNRDSARYFIRDEGPGFNPDLIPDPLDPANLEKVSGRGILLMRLFMDEVTFNERGNELTMIKRRKVPRAEA
jgi:CheY-like chemotaxis protein